VTTCELVLVSIAERPGMDGRIDAAGARLACRISDSNSAGDPVLHIGLVEGLWLGGADVASLRGRCGVSR
jgi:hypothetical protein